MTTKTNLFDVDAEGRKTVAEVGENCYSFQMTVEELTANIQLLNFAKNTFNALGADAASKGDLETVKLYQAREEVARTLHSRFKLLAAVGEPKSRDVH